MRLRDILSAKVDHDDMRKNFKLLEAIDQYVLNKRTPQEGKLKALAKLDTIMQLPTPNDPVFAMKVYVSTRESDFV